MSEISYLILHFERPYLLDINIRIVNHFLPKGSEIIVADDGSRTKVVNQFDKLPISHLYVSSQNKNELGSGTCSNTINNARKFIKKEYFIFSEDDFIFVPNPVTDINTKGLLIDEEEGKIIPKTSYKTDFNFFEEAISILNSNKNIKNIQMARDSIRVPTIGSLKTDNVEWVYVNRDVKKEFYYCNWPNLWYSKDFESLHFPDSLPIWKLEGYLSKRVEGMFDKHGNWAVCPKNRFYLHLGFPFSKRPKGSKGIEKREKDLERIQTKVYSKIVDSKINDFNSFLTSQWIKGNFKIELEEVLNNNLNYAYWNALKRIEDKIC